MWIARTRNIYTYAGEPWGLDNGAFRDWAERKPFDGDQFQRVLDKALQHPKPLLAVIPDAPGNATGTMNMLDEWLPTLPDLPWYVAVQDGMEPEHLEGYPISGVFLGGTNRYKATAPLWREWTHQNGLPFHFGRCGTPNKVAFAMEVGADSIDSAFPMWSEARWNFFVDVVTNGPHQLSLLGALAL